METRKGYMICCLSVIFLLFPMLIAFDAHADIIIDNRDAATSQTGFWDVSNGTNQYGADSVFGRNGVTFTWHFTAPQSGNYAVSMWWTYRDTRSTGSPVDIEYSGGAGRVFVNQKQIASAGVWNALGTYAFEAGKSYRITITAAPTPTSAATTCADAVKFVYVSSGGNQPPTAVIDSISPNPASPGQAVTFTGHGADADGSVAAYEWQSSIGGLLSTLNTFTTSSLGAGTHTISFRVQDNNNAWSAPVTQILVVGSTPSQTIIDNRDAATSQTGFWDVSNGANQYGADSVFGRNGVTFTWHFTAPQSGNYAVSMWWTYRDTRSTGSPVDIEYSGGAGRVFVNQKQIASAGVWNALGTYAFEAGKSYRITITAAPTPTSAATTCADAVKFVYVSSGGNQPPTAVIDSISPNPASPGQAVTFTGHGTDADGSVAAYEWQSSIGGLLSTLNTFTTSSLGAGTHTISFRVQDNNNAWSAPVTQILVVGSTPVNQPPTAVIDSISPNPASPGQAVTFTGHGTDADGSVAAYEWRSSIDGLLSTLNTFTTSSLGAGTHTISFRVQDNGGAWSSVVSRNLEVSSQTSNTEHIYIGPLFGGYKGQFIQVLNSLGARQEGDLWRYTNAGANKAFIIHFLEDVESTIQAMYTQDAHIILQGHSNYGLGAVYATPAENQEGKVYDLYYMDDDKLLNCSSPWVSLNVKSCIESHAFPNWWPAFEDGTSAVMPYVHGDPQGEPPYNYYLTYQVPGGPTYYRIETVHNSALQRFADSGRPAWDSTPNGTSPSPANPDHLKYYITNTDTSPVTRLCGSRTCPRPHYGSKTIVFRKEDEIEKDKLKYKRMLYASCSTGIYYLDTLQHGIMFYSVASAGGTPASVYLKAYLEGKSDYEIWRLMQDVDPKYDYYNFNKRPSEQ